MSAAYERIKEQNCLPAVCGRICSAPCEAACVLMEEESPIGVRALERYAADFGKPRLSRRERVERKGKKVAVVGSGPAGLAASADLARKGYQVTIFEALEKPGGVLRYGIPEFRIPRKVLDGEINDIKALGVNIETNFFIGQTATVADLKEQGYAAILLTTGAGIPQFMDLPGTNFGGVYYGEEFLMRVNLMKVNIFSRNIPNFVIGPKVVVIGSGNTALDCARASVRFGREVKLIFRRTEEDMRVRPQEREYGKEEGIQLEPLVRPVEILADQNNFVSGVKCVRMDYAEAEESDAWELMPVPDSEFIIEADTVIIAIGHKPNSIIKRTTPQLKCDPDETIKVDSDTHMTAIKGVFSAGNVVTNAGPLVEAIASGKSVAEDIHQYLTK